MTHFALPSERIALCGATFGTFSSLPPHVTCGECQTALNTNIAPPPSAYSTLDKLLIACIVSGAAVWCALLYAVLAWSER